MTRRKKSRKANNSQRHALVLIVVLIVVVVLSLSAYTFTALMVAQREAVKLTGRQIQARALVDSGVEVTRIVLAQDSAAREDAGGIYDNPTMFQGLLVVDDELPQLRGRVTIIGPAIDDEGNLGGFRFGLQDESTRLNLNALLLADDQQEDGGRELLMGLPGMTEEIADAILDWIDEDDDPREYGAEVDYYTSLDPPYAPKNGPLDTVEELLLVRGVLPQLLFGADVNRNGMVDLNESAGVDVSSEGIDNSEGLLDLGWSVYLTLYSLEKNETLEGEPRIDINGQDLEQLYNDLQGAIDQNWATFIVAYRQNGPYTGDDEAESSGSGSLDFTQEGQTQFVQVLDLVGAKTRVRFDGDEEPTILASPVQEDSLGLSLPTLMDKLTTNATPTIPGRININQCSRAVLSGIPGMDDEIADAIISRRDVERDDDDPNRRHETWILAEAIVELDEMRAMLPYVTGGGGIFRAQVVGYFEGGGASSRAEVVFDATGSMPRILFWRDMSHLGRGFDLETLGVDLGE